MPKRTDIKKILVVGSGPIVIGQACEFDYSGTQAIKSLQEEGYKVVLVNSNPATIMTDTELSQKVYIEPITLPYLETIIKIERPDAILPTVGGQTALNITLELAEKGILEKYGVEIIGANKNSIKKAEDRELFKKAMKKLGYKTPFSKVVHSTKEASTVLGEIGLPIILRPSFTLGGSGGGICYNEKDFDTMINKAITESPSESVLLEQSILGWKEFELEVMRDMADNVIIVCSIENIDPMGIHTGDSITIAPQQTLSDKEYQNLRDMAIAIIREIGVETGGSNIQFAVNPENGEVFVIEMNPRVSRSSALASKATGFPIARIASKLAVGYYLYEIANDITKKTPASFEPTLDYFVTKIPRFNFEKFSNANKVLHTQMKSVGEAMAIGRTFGESFQKALRSLEINCSGWGLDDQVDISVKLVHKKKQNLLFHFLKENLTSPSDKRIFYIREAFHHGFSLNEIYNLTRIDKWFLYQLEKLLDYEKKALQFFAKKSYIIKSMVFQRIIFLKGYYTVLEKIGFFKNIFFLKQHGYSYTQITYLLFFDTIQKIIRNMASLARDKEGGAGNIEYLQKKDNIKNILEKNQKKLENLCHSYIKPVSKRVDTCAAEFQSYTPYLYLTYELEDESNVSNRDKVIILGSGPNRIGQGIEFDYCCCHASYALQEMGVESIMINSNPETVSTDYDTSDRLYFEPITLETIVSIYNIESRKGNVLGIIPQFGGQTPLKIARQLVKRNLKILGTSVHSIDIAEDREKFTKLMKRVGMQQPKGEIAFSMRSALAAAKRIGYPVLVRPSYVLGGRAMQIVYSSEQLHAYMLSSSELSTKTPVLIDQYLEDAVEFDVDAIFDGEDIFIAGILEHVEEAGIHSGDSACIFPPNNVSSHILQEMKRTTYLLARELNVVGCINIQFALQGKKLFVLEVNPRASRTIPFISKATQIPIAKIATKIILGKKLKDFQLKDTMKPGRYYVKEVVLPFKKFVQSDSVLGPEMKSTGEVMGIGKTTAEAFYKAQEAIYQPLPKKGNIFVSINDKHKRKLLDIFQEINITKKFTLFATSGTNHFFTENNIQSQMIPKIGERRPNVLDHIQSGKIHLAINIAKEYELQENTLKIRLACLENNIPYCSTIYGTIQVIKGIIGIQKEKTSVYPFTKNFAR